MAIPMQRVLDLVQRLIKGRSLACPVGMVVLAFSNVVPALWISIPVSCPKRPRAGYLSGSRFSVRSSALREHRHLGIDTLVRRLSPRGQAHLLRDQLRA